MSEKKSESVFSGKDLSTDKSKFASQKITIDFLIEFSHYTKTDQATYFASQLKDVVIVTNRNSYYVFDNIKKLFIEQNEGQYYTYFCDYVNTFIKKMQELKSKIKCICFDDSPVCECGAKRKNNVLSSLIKDFDTKTYIKDVAERSYGKLYDTEFDKKINNISNLLPLQNGKIIDLKTLKVRDRTVNDKFTFECPVSYLPDSDLKHADKFFCDIMPNDKEREYLRKSLGYMLTGEVDARIFFIWYGNGSNGKSVVINLITKILDKFYVSADKAVFCKLDNKNSGAASPHIYALLGKRMIAYSEGETSDNIEMNFSTMKQISGDDELSCRGLYKDQITFKSCGKLNFLTNHIPRLSKEDAVFNRTRMICYNEEFVEHPTGKQKKKDTQFTDNLMTIYLNEVFTWICQGSKMFYEDRRIIMPQTFQQQTETFMNQEDSIASFLTHRVDFTNVYKDSIKKNDIFNAYNDYCKESGLRCQARSLLFSRLDHKKVILAQLHGCPVYRGIKVKDAPTEEDPLEHGIVKEDVKEETKQELTLEQQIQFHEEQLKKLYQQQIDNFENEFQKPIKAAKTTMKRIIPIQKVENKYISKANDEAEDFDFDAYFKE